MHLVMIELFFSEGFMTIFAKQFGPIWTCSGAVWICKVLEPILFSQQDFPPTLIDSPSSYAANCKTGMRTSGYLIDQSQICSMIDKYANYSFMSLHACPMDGSEESIICQIGVCVCSTK